jgi:competence protein ComEC
LVRHAEALNDDCRLADLVVVPVAAHPFCPSARLLVDGWMLKRRGTHALWLNGDGSVRAEAVADWQGDRPWSQEEAAKQVQ